MKTLVGIRAAAILFAAWPLLSGAAGCLTPPAGLIGWWPGEGNANDIAGSNNGTLSAGAMASASGVTGLAFTFNGTNGYVQISDAPALRPANLTIETWVRFDSLDSLGSGGSPAGDQYLVFKQNTRSGDFEGFDLSKTRSGGGDVFRFLVTSATAQMAQIQSSTRITAGVWYHVAAVRGSNFTQLYVNGQLERQTNAAFAQDYGTLPLYFGSSGQSYWDHKFAGALDEVSLYNRALSASEIASIYAAGAAGKCKSASPVSITTQPRSQSVSAGSSATFTVTATGTAPLSYQWQFNRAAIAGASGSSLTLNNVQTNAAGSYTVVVSNSFNAITSAVATLSVTQPGGCAAPPAGLVSWWPGDGDASDLLANNNGALQGGAVANAAGMVGSAFGFDGTNGFFRIPDSPLLRPANLTIEAWVRFSSLDSLSLGGSPPGDQYIVFKQNTRSGDFEGFDLSKTRVSGGDVFRFLITSATAQTAMIQSVTHITTGVWYHVAAVRGSNFTQLYVNGQFEAQTSVSFPMDYGTLPLYFGTSGQSYWDHKLKGSLDEVSLYGRALSANEISALYTAGAAGKCRSATAPTITSQPQSQSVLAGSSVSFAVAASGTAPLIYQWRKDGANLSDGGAISGAHAPRLQLATVQTNDAGSYQVVVANGAGSVTSTAASLAVSVAGPTGPVRADAVVLVNSHSARFLDFQQRLQPYLDNFGVPYTVQDISVTAPGQSISNYAVIILGHSQLDLTQAYLNGVAQANISLAVSNGAGLVSFDNNLSAGATPRYQFVQDIFGFTYGTGASGSSVSLPATEPSSQMHYITSRHPANDAIGFRSSITLPGIVPAAGATAVAVVAGQPLVVIKKYGQGRAVQWGSSDWMISTVLGPVDGLDDVLWRGLVWAARKPFVMRGMPNLVTMRVDDAEGPFGWAHDAINAGFKPFITFFLSSISETSAADLRGMVTNGNATASIHSISASTMFYFDHQNLTSYSDSVQSNNFYIGTQWHASHGIPISKVCATHYSEIGPNAFAGLKAWGMEYVPIEIVPGTVEYATPGAPWLVGGPYRRYESPQPGKVNWPTYYADWLAVPGHPELDGQFFNIYSEVRDVSSCAEWCPDNDVAGSISRATKMARRTLDSMAMTTIFSHEWYIHPTSCCGSTTISTSNWRAILSGITNNLASYNPSYVTLDYASQYVRATRTSRLVASGFDPALGQVTLSFSGKTDLATYVHIFAGQDASITDSLRSVPVFSGSITAIVANVTGSMLAPAALPAARLLAPAAQDGQVSFQLEGQIGRTYAIEASSDLESWSEISQVTLARQAFIFKQPTTGIRRFYRAKLLP